MARLLTLTILGLLLFALSWNPGPSSPIAPGAIHVSWSGWPFVCKRTHRKQSPTGGNQIVHTEYAKPELIINLSIAITLLTLLYVGLTHFAFKSFPRLSLLDILSLVAGASIAVAYFSSNPDTFLWNLGFVTDDGTKHRFYVLQRPVWQNSIACVCIVLAGYSGMLILCATKRRITM